MLFSFSLEACWKAWICLQCSLVLCTYSFLGAVSFFLHPDLGANRLVLLVPHRIIKSGDPIPLHRMTSQQMAAHHSTWQEITWHRVASRDITQHRHGTAEGSFAQKTRFGHRSGWSPCAHSIGKFLLWLIVFFFETSAPAFRLDRHFHTLWLDTI